MTATLYSTDYGLTFPAPVDAGDGGDLGGADTSKIGGQIILDASGQAYKANDGGAYSSYGTGENEGFVWIPRKTFSAGNNTGSNPEYLLIALVDDSGDSMWRVTSTGSVFTDITKTITGNPGLSSGINCAHIPWFSAARMAALLLFSTQLKLITTSNIGVSWTDRGDYDGDTGYIRFRKGDQNMAQLYFIADGIPYYSKDIGATASARTYPEDPTDAPALCIEPYG